MTDRELMQQVYQYLTGESVRNKTSDAYIAQIINERLAQPEQEPVAYIGTNGELMWLHKPHAIYSKARPLYTAPPQRKPLTDEDDRLIAAAPDLLAALQGLLRGIFDGPDEANAAMLVAKARDAVNKATGGEKE